MTTAARMVLYNTTVSRWCVTARGPHQFTLSVEFCVNGVTANSTVEAPSVTWPTLSLPQRRHRLHLHRHCFSFEERWRWNCSDDRTVTHVTERHWINTAANVTAALQSSWKMISVVTKLIDEDGDDQQTVYCVHCTCCWWPKLCYSARFLAGRDLDRIDLAE